MNLWRLSGRMMSPPFGGNLTRKVTTLVVRAEDEDEARRIASEHAGEEGADTWKNPGVSRCEKLFLNGFPGVIARELGPDY